MMSKRLCLDDVEWKEFKISDLFIIKDGYYNKKPPKTGYDETLPFLGATAFNNGITEFYSEDTIVQWDKVGNKSTLNSSRRFFNGNCLVIVNNGSVGKVYYQPSRFTCSHDITPLYLNDYFLNKELAMFLAKCLERTGETFTYARKWRPKRIRTSKIFLPINDKKEPNWQFMEDYIKQEQKLIAQKVIDYYEQKMLETAFDLVGLEDVEWKVFSFDDIFRRIQRGKRLKKDDHIEGNKPYVSSTSLNNGVDDFIGNKEDVRKFENNLTVANSGSVGSCFYHQYEYIASDHVTSLTLENGDKYIYLFMASIVKRLEEKYSFNREINDRRIRREKIILPVKENGQPYWEYMSQFMQKIEAEKLEKAIEYIYIYIYKLAISKGSKLASLEEKEWKEFWLEDIVTLKSGKDIYERERIDGNTPYVTATAQNNGIGYFVENKNKTIEEKAISVNRNGSVGYAFYHEYKALYGNDTRKLIPKYRNKYVSLFLTSVITKQKEKYGYGYKMGTGRLKRQKILLPIDGLGHIDFDYMKKYMQVKEIKEQYKILNYYQSNK
ncbi:restriction endonuclease subunit S [Peptoniphilus sp.]|uniref:restriction endonuclease subunit S n=1 Tax=Peptoniphilus sp. TaxID=1971214 RepID=UPI002A83E34C|nr:restriction endonuclease subunit S [Peptoniphilus sp.]MDY3903142.1 restriction endonuclease subunit S [Peptoniphilus sp.]